MAGIAQRRRDPAPVDGDGEYTTITATARWCGTAYVNGGGACRALPMGQIWGLLNSEGPLTAPTPVELAAPLPLGQTRVSGERRKAVPLAFP